MPSINELKAAISAGGGLAMANRYAVFLNLPKAWGLPPHAANMLCDASSLPGRNIVTFDYQAHRQAIKLPNGYANEDVSLSFMLTNDYSAKMLFDTWMQVVLNTAAYRVNYNSLYTTDVSIYQLDKNNNAVYGVTLQGAWPHTSNGIDLANASENTPQKYIVTLAYYDYKVMSKATGTLPSKIS